jgi:hypothetical protein
MGIAFRRWAFPAHTWQLRQARGISIGFRTVHLAAFGSLLGGHIFAVDPAVLLPYLYFTILSGLGLSIVEAYGVACYWLFMGKGLVVLLKLALLLLIPVFWEARVVLLVLVVVIASVGSHMPARYRNYSVLQHRALGDSGLSGVNLSGASKARATTCQTQGGRGSHDTTRH